MNELRQLVIHHQGVEQAYAMAQKRTEQTIAGLQKLPAGAAQDDLIRLTQSLLNRKA
ncbi:heptaprenyl diphosphate synthase component II [Lacticaseibacillus casei UW4]|nr:heptaprenyl diphosphate synthase component II [Lacticaseibacillus casei UW4]